MARCVLKTRRCSSSMRKRSTMCSTTGLRWSFNSGTLYIFLFSIRFRIESWNNFTFYAILQHEIMSFIFLHHYVKIENRILACFGPVFPLSFFLCWLNNLFEVIIIFTFLNHVFDSSTRFRLILTILFCVDVLIKCRFHK